MIGGRSRNHNRFDTLVNGPLMQEYAEKIKARAFAEFARRYGVEALLDCLERNEQAGIVYHREGILGDYDEFDDLEELITYIRTGKR